MHTVYHDSRWDGRTYGSDAFKGKGMLPGHGATTMPIWPWRNPWRYAAYRNNNVLIQKCDNTAPCTEFLLTRGLADT